MECLSQFSSEISGVTFCFTDSSIDFRQFQKFFLSELSVLSSSSEILLLSDIHFFYYSVVFYTVLKLRGILHGGWHLKGRCVSG